MLAFQFSERYICNYFFLGGCHLNISISGGQKACTGQDFNITCQFDCYGYQVKLMKGKQVEHSLQSNNDTVIVSKQIQSANKSHSGQYSCQTEPPDLLSIAQVTVEGKSEISWISSFICIHFRTLKFF